MTEIEIKVQIESDHQLKDFLKNRAELVKESRQIDQYFSPRDQSFLAADPVKEWLRLRREGSQTTLNYKYWHYQADGTSHHSDEYETAIGDFDQAKSILLALRLEPIITVDKRRRGYRYQDYEIAIDEVKNLGSFVEIEWKGKGGVDPKEITEQMMIFLAQFQPGRIERGYKGYPKLLLEQKLGRSLN